MATTKIPQELLEKTSITFADNEKLNFGTSDDLQIYHDGSNSYVKDAGTGNLNLQGENLALENTSGDNYFVGVNGSFAKIYYSGVEKLATTSTGVTITGVAVATSFTGALTGNASTATALATGRTVGMTGDVVWTSASFDGSGNVTGSATMVINSTTITASGTALSNVVSDINGAGISGVSAKAVNGRLAIFSTTNNIVIAEGNGLLAEVGITAGTYYLPKLNIAPHTSVPEFKSTDTNPRPTGSVWFKTSQSNLGANLKVKNFNGNTNLWTDIGAPIYATNMAALKALDSTGGGLNLAVGTVYVQSNTTEAAAVEADFKIFRRKNTGSTTVTSSIIAAQVSAGTYAFTISESTTNSNN